MTLPSDQTVRDALADPFGEPQLDATLPPPRPALGVVGVVVFLAAAMVLLAARSLFG